MYDINNLTDLERIVLQASMSFWNYGTRDEKDDNAVCFNVADLGNECDLNLPTIKGVVGSLFKKGLFVEMECGELHQNTEIGLSDDGIDAACDICEDVLGGPDPVITKEEFDAALKLIALYGSQNGSKEM